MSHRKILLADDEAYVTSILALKLKQLGDEVVLACDGQEGFDLACEHLPTIIVTDFQMPNLTGYEMAVKLKQNDATARIPVLMLTARGHLLSAAELAQTNICGLMQKPFSAKELIGRIAELIGPPLSAAA